MPLIDSQQLAASIVERMTDLHLEQLLAAVNRLHLRLPRADTATMERAECAFRASLITQIDTAISDGGSGIQIGLDRGNLSCWLESALEEACAAAGCP